MDKKINKCKRDLQAKITMEGKNLESAFVELKSEYEEIGYDEVWFTALAAAKGQLDKQQKGIERLGKRQSLRGQTHEKWYNGPPENSRFWPAYVKHLESKGDDWKSAIPSIDESSSAAEIVQ